MNTSETLIVLTCLLAAPLVRCGSSSGGGSGGAGGTSGASSGGSGGQGTGGTGGSSGGSCAGVPVASCLMNENGAPATCQEFMSASTASLFMKSCQNNTNNVWSDGKACSRTGAVAGCSKSGVTTIYYTGTAAQAATICTNGQGTVCAP